jgi:hypothetical protein
MPIPETVDDRFPRCKIRSTSGEYPSTFYGCTTCGALCDYRERETHHNWHMKHGE